MRQRAKLAGALVHDPPILLLDEPFNGMDPRQRLHMMALLRSMAAEGRTILFSSHILEEVERLADSILVVYAGPAGGVGRLPLDPAADDRPAAHVHGPLVGRPPAGRGADGRRRRSSGPSWSTAGWPIRTADYGGVHPGPAAHRPRRPA